MTPYASVALFRRNNEIVFKRPRKERPGDVTQARKAAMRFWRGNATNGDTLVKVILLRERAGKLEVSERAATGSWSLFEREIAAAIKEPHVAACVAELGVDAEAAPPTVPDVLVINGHTYRRDI